MAKVTNSDILNTPFTPGATGLFRCTVSGGSVQIMTSADGGTTWAPCGDVVKGAVDLNNTVAGLSYKFVSVAGAPVVRADQ